MIDVAIAWLLAYPLESVGVLVVFVIGFGVLLIPRPDEVVRHGPPRC